MNKIYFNTCKFAAFAAFLTFAVRIIYSSAQEKGPMLNILFENIQINAQSYLKADEHGHVKPHYISVSPQSGIRVKLQMGDSSAQDEGRLVVVESGQIRFRHHLNFVNLSQRPNTTTLSR